MNIFFSYRYNCDDCCFELSFDCKTKLLYTESSPGSCKSELDDDVLSNKISGRL